MNIYFVPFGASRAAGVLSCMVLSLFFFPFSVSFSSFGFLRLLPEEDFEFRIPNEPPVGVFNDRPKFKSHTYCTWRWRDTERERQGGIRVAIISSIIVIKYYYYY